MTLQEYETYRDDDDKKNINHGSRRKKKLNVSTKVRIRKLKKAGYKLNDIMEASDDAQRIRELRMESMNDEGLDLGV